MSDKPNRLIHENSPYLLQHAYNAVDWHPWCEAAFAKAEEENKPVFLSIGYSTCHWCHVMERESFENPEIGEILNAHFISIKVDREERPDVDQLYMSYATAMSGSGGWPLSVFTGPDKKPFLVATYLPPRNLGQRKGLKELALEIQTLWSSQREKILNSSREMFDYVLELDQINAQEIPPDIFETANEAFKRSYDRIHGGLGNGQKFPCPQNLLYLMGQAGEKNDPGLANMALDTLRAMRLSGIFDHVGFGFHRYATDPAWHLPHFEKMLYDQAMLLMAYAEAWKTTGDEFFKTAAEEIIHFIRREMYDSSSGFFSAYDADSEGREGKFYVFDLGGLGTILKENEIEFLKTRFGFTEEGNFHDEASGALTGENLFSLGGLPSLPDLDFRKHLEIWEPIRRKIHACRENRVKPGLDDKIIMEWNCMTIGALAGACSSMDSPEALELSEQCMQNLQTSLTDPDGDLLRYRRDHHVSGQGFLNDYAWYVFARLELYEATQEISHLSLAIQTQEKIVELFLREESGKFSVNQKEQSDLAKNIFDDYDGAYPSAASVNTHNMLRLDNYLHCPQLKKIAEKNLENLAGSMAKYPMGYAWWLIALEYLRLESRQILIIAPFDSKEGNKALKTVKRFSHRRTACVFKHEKNANSVEELMPWTASMSAESKETRIYLCRDYRCELPMTSTEELEKTLEEARPSFHEKNKGASPQA